MRQAVAASSTRTAPPGDERWSAWRPWSSAIRRTRRRETKRKHNAEEFEAKIQKRAEKRRRRKERAKSKDEAREEQEEEQNEEKKEKKKKESMLERVSWPVSGLASCVQIEDCVFCYCFLPYGGYARRRR
ncbi:hypothetical protein PF004_g29216 [Phytophthora fragariae]|uniref:Uncharacterized protein n=1 Tax=Phytophthora fragariae TaxID=53985 RepID=A0A6A3DMS0_9STRA|nr:hypothetical protein PF009_g30007 [Phytophthora fragariae]KAE9166290.1 hypothetical protein PF004_g29216 [Phytophthora fragariae]